MMQRWRGGFMGVVAIAVAIVSATASAGSPDPWRPIDSGGGNWAAPVTSGHYVYAPIGAVIEVFDVANPAAPVAVGRTSASPLPGGIQDAVVIGTHLYATWTSYAGPGGVAVYDLANPATPTLVANVDDYIASEFKRPAALAAAGNTLYFFDSENGIFVADVAGGAVPTFTHALIGFGAYADAVVSGNRIYTVGRGFIGGPTVEVFDVTTPTAPVSLGASGFPSGIAQSAVLAPPLGIGLGFGIEIVDFSDPTTPVSRAFADTPPIFAGGVRNGWLYTVGAEDVSSWSLADLDNFALGATLPVDVVGARFVVPTTSGFAIATQTDRLRFFDASTPASPTLASTAAPAAGTDARDAAFLPNHTLIAQNAYGLTVHAPGDLRPAARFDADLDPALQARAIESMDVEGNRAYLGSWGSGIVAVDITDPMAPVELAQFPQPFTSAVDAVGTTVYAGKSTDGGAVFVLDASVPSQLTLRGSIATSKVMGLAARGTRVFVADEQVFDVGGLRIIDASDPTTPTLVGHYSACDSGLGVDANADGTIAYLACVDGGLHIVDTSDPANPVAIGVFEQVEDFNTAHAVRVVGTRAYLAHEFGVDVIDVHDRAHPTFVTRLSTGFPVVNVRVARNGDVWAFTSLGGVIVFDNETLFEDGFE